LRLSIVIVNYNTGTLLEECLSSIEEKIQALSVLADTEVVVVDNASTDGSEKAAANSKNVLLVRSEKNIGFAAGCNLGAETAGGDHILFLNPDTRILSPDMTAFLDSFEVDSTAGAVGCQNILPGGEIQTTAYRFPGLMQPLFFSFGFRNLLEYRPLRLLLSPFLKKSFGQFDPHSERRTVDWVTGAFLLVKRKAWVETGPFDERFFLFCEEIDWCKRLAAKGFRTVFDPSFEIEHHVGQSSKNVKPFVLLQKYKSYLAYFEKHHSTSVNVWLKLIFVFGNNFRIAVNTVAGDSESVSAYRSLKEGLDI
jgi:hypothetical protein